MRVGTKELKNRLSHYVRAVRAGEVVQITDRGRVVAEIRGSAAGPARARLDEEAGLERLAAAGILTRGTGRRADFEPVKARGRVRLSDWVTQDRR